MWCSCFYKNQKKNPQNNTQPTQRQNQNDQNQIESNRIAQQQQQQREQQPRQQQEQQIQRQQIQQSQNDEVKQLDIYTNMQLEDLKELEIRTTEEDFKIYKYSCPICLVYYNMILKTSCCNNYVCVYCINDIEEQILSKKIERKCWWCRATDFQIIDVGINDEIKNYSDIIKSKSNIHLSQIQNNQLQVTKNPIFDKFQTFKSQNIQLINNQPKTKELKFSKTLCFSQKQNDEHVTQEQFAVTFK